MVGLALSLAIDLAAIARSPTLRHAVNSFFGLSPVSAMALVYPLVVVGVAAGAVAVARRLRWPPTVHGRGLLSLAALTAAVLLLALAAYVDPVFLFFQRGLEMIGYHPLGLYDTDASLLILLLLVTPIATIGLLLRLNFTSWNRLVLCAAALVPAYAYLALDDATIERPLPMTQLSPVVPRAAESFAVYLRYGSNHPLGKNYTSNQSSYKIWTKAAFLEEKDPAQYSAWLRENRAELESEWEALAPVRAWWDELNSFEVIGDLSSADPYQELVRFTPVRELVMHATAIAGLRALDGQGDQAFAILLPIIQVSHKLQPCSRRLIRTLVSRLSERYAMDTARFVLSRTKVSALMQARFRAALETEWSPEDGAQRIFDVEYAHWLETVTTIPIGTRLLHNQAGGRSCFEEPLNLLSPFVFNIRHSANVYGHLSAELAGYARRRELGEIAPAMRAVASSQEARIKNRMGFMLVASDGTSMARIVDSYWKVEDDRRLLIGRLSGTPD